MSKLFNIQLFILILSADLIYSAVLHPRLRRIRNHEINKSIHLNGADENELNRQEIQLSSTNDDSSSLVNRLISSLTASGENIELIIQNPINDQQQEEIKKRKRNDCFFSLVNCRLVQTTSISRTLERIQSEIKNNSKQRREHKRRSRKLIKTKL
ncbi:unnamed protein product [Meloidogyne enterolobii]|uniref:Uncharacterized protein n=2 Tax=Meloidogyne enterolobii TaxID=390850 RepID=A0ACB0ZVB8_MELEN|nr:unnamed protein product [Meloidogyne enterolobii]